MENIGTSSYNSRFLTGLIVENRRLQACVDDDAAFQAEAAKAGKDQAEDDVNGAY